MNPHKTSLGLMVACIIGLTVLNLTESRDITKLKRQLAEAKQQLKEKKPVQVMFTITNEITTPTTLITNLNLLKHLKPDEVK